MLFSKGTECQYTNFFIKYENKNNKYQNISSFVTIIEKYAVKGRRQNGSERNLEGEGGVCITATGNILDSGKISLKLFLALLERIELLIFWYVVAEHHIGQL